MKNYDFDHVWELLHQALPLGSWVFFPIAAGLRYGGGPPLAVRHLEPTSGNLAGRASACLKVRE